ncbi:DUF1540 domain-containing protein [Heliobacillus mobilis]|uniref:DUF1540 domain-containing protein n=2 Tax=Heliobacterium TaxID=2697 RepID=A0A6I3SLL2_HELMO|nr:MULTISPECIES: DUF1540 domain-containing protein [Heliobacterium]MBC9785592.1 DUF1540 domain-containing protein [Heliobacterium chlorum]MTV49779.1 DUF1540 domain-containing protein [Heliobacterium mobile]
MGEIHCQVEECVHNASKMCKASAINVKSRGTQRPKTTDETACETFKSR